MGQTEAIRNDLGWWRPTHNMSAERMDLCCALDMAHRGVFQQLLPRRAGETDGATSARRGLYCWRPFAAKREIPAPVN